MCTTPASPSVEVLKNVRAQLHACAPQFCVADVELLEQIANLASQVAQDLRIEHDALMAQLDEHEALMADRLMAESDALDHMA